MKKIIKLTESDLHRIVTESVHRILEAHGEGLSYTTAKSAYNKMLDLGQNARAEELNKTYADVNNDDDVSYNLRNDDITFNGGDKNPDTVFYGNHITPSDNVGGTRTTRRYKDGTVYDANESDFIPQAARVTDPKSAIRRANHLNNFAGRKKFGKNNFRA